MEWQIDERGQYRIEWRRPGKTRGERGYHWTRLTATYHEAAATHHPPGREGALALCRRNWPKCEYRVVTPATTATISV